MGRLTKSWCWTLLLLVTLTPMPVRTQQSSQGTLLLRIDPECSITNPATVYSGGGEDGALSATTTFRYKLRTSKTGGGSIQLKLDRPGALFHYTLRLPTGEFAGSQPIPESSGVTVARFGAGAHSSREGDTGTVRWTLKGAHDTSHPRVEVTIGCN